MDNKSTTKRMIGAVVLVLVAALLLAWLLKGKNRKPDGAEITAANGQNEQSQVQPISNFPSLATNQQTDPNAPPPQPSITEQAANAVNGGAEQAVNGVAAVGNDANQAVGAAQTVTAEAATGVADAANGVATDTASAAQQLAADGTATFSIRPGETQGIMNQDGTITPANGQQPVAAATQAETAQATPVATEANAETAQAQAVPATAQAETAATAQAQTAESGKPAAVAQVQAEGKTPAKVAANKVAEKAAPEKQVVASTKKAEKPAPEKATNTASNANASTASRQPRLVAVEKPASTPTRTTASESRSSSASSRVASSSRSSEPRASTASASKSVATASAAPAAKAAATVTTASATKPAASDKVDTKVAVSKSSGYVVQVLATADQGKAKGLSSSIASDGFPVFVAQASVNGKAVYRVRVGTYNAKNEADKIQARLKSRYSQNEFVQNSFVTNN